MWVWDIPSDEFWMSERGRAIRGYNERDRLDFQRFLSSVHPDDRDRVRRSVEELLAKSVGEFDGEYRILVPDGGIRWISARGRVEFDAEGKPLRMRGISIDNTARKTAELELARQRDEVTHLSRVAMLGELSGALAHELNQPLAAILFSAQAAQRFRMQANVNPREIDAILESIVAQDKHASEVILRTRALLAKGEVNLQPLDLGEVVDEAVRVVKSDLDSHGVAVSILRSPGLPQIRADRVQMQQVLLNLVINGCNAMAGTAAAARQLRIRTEFTDGGGVLISVSDRGCGIPPGDLERIFEPFVTTKAGGLGLGLAVCRTIVSAHGGRLWADNNTDGGATFSFTLPAAHGPTT
jgi:C4-dicarboxylate-specific signal transduction histidine kinase